MPFNDYLYGPRLDGLLGCEFLSRHRLSINFRRREVVIWELRKAADRSSVLAGEQKEENRY